MVQGIFQLLQTMVVCGTLLGGGFIWAINSPSGKFRDFIMQVTGWGMAGLSVLYAVSPDLMPFFPGDDIVVLAGGLFAAYKAWEAGLQKKLAA